MRTQDRDKIKEGFLKDKGYNLIVVPNAKDALVCLAKFNRARSKATILAVTGSVGKTSTKEALSLICLTAGTTFCNSGNFNNDLGLPITLASMPLNVQYGIFELGMNHAGEIEVLTNIVQPDIAVITAIENTHLENFKSVEDIARAKGEIFLGMNADGIAVINGDNKYYNLLASMAKTAGIKKVFSFGKTDNNDSFLVSYSNEIRAKICGEEISYKIKANGHHQALNSIAALTVAKILGMDLQLSAAALAGFSSMQGRGEISELNILGKKIRIIDDSYNASPASVKASLVVIKSLSDDSIQRKIAVLGDMHELGLGAVDEHLDLLSAIKDSGITCLITMGPLMKHLFDITPDQTKLVHFESYREAKIGILTLIKDHDCILFKGSHGTKMYEVVQYLKKQAV